MVAVLLIGAMTTASFWILLPFLPALLWATMIVVATRPLMLHIQERLWGKRMLAVVAMTAAWVLVFVVPLSLAVATIVENANAIAGWWRTLADFTVPPPPDWLEKVPLVGPDLSDTWQQALAAHPEELTARLSPYVGMIIRWFVDQVGNFAGIFFNFLLTVVIAAILYARGEVAADGVNRFAQRVAGLRGENAARLAAQAIRAVALGIIVTAIIQSALSWIGLAVAGVPYATLLTALVFMLTVAQIGTIPVLVCSVIWLYWKGDLGWATALLVWTVIVGSIDNFLRPILIKRGADLPLLLIFAGVIGGLVAFGIIGVFIGPVVLAVSYTLLVAWVNDADLGAVPYTRMPTKSALPSAESGKGALHSEHEDEEEKHATEEY